MTPGDRRYGPRKLCRNGLHPMAGRNVLIWHVAGRGAVRRCRQCWEKRYGRKKEERAKRRAERDPDLERPARDSLGKSTYIWQNWGGYGPW